MSSCHTYDPSNFHSSQTRPVFIRLDGSIMRMIRPAAGVRVRKRAIWNESPIEVPLNDSPRRFELLGGSVELSPRGLARKRHFSRKYPIQLVVRELLTAKNEPTSPMTLGSFSSPDSDRNGRILVDSKDGVEGEHRNFGDTILYSNVSL